MLSSKGENTEHKIVKMFVIVGDSERHMGEFITLFSSCLHMLGNKRRKLSPLFLLGIKTRWVELQQPYWIMR